MSEDTELRCKWCHRDITNAMPRGRRPEYCKPSCQKNAYELRRLELLLESEAGQAMLQEAVNKAVALAMERREEIA